MLSAKLALEKDIMVGVLAFQTLTGLTVNDLRLVRIDSQRVGERRRTTLSHVAATVELTEYDS